MENENETLEKFYGIESKKIYLKKFGTEGSLLYSKPLELTFLFLDFELKIKERISLNPEDILNFTNNCYGFVHSCTSNLGGEIVSHYGDSFFVVFGLKSDAHLQGALLSVGLFDAVIKTQNHKENNLELIPHFGIHTGVGLVGNFGNESSGYFDVKGQDVSLTARIQGLAVRYGKKYVISEKVNENIALITNLSSEQLEDNLVINGQRVKTYWLKSKT